VLETINQKQAPKILSGHVAVKRIRCGKSNCRCARGAKHIAYYHVTYAEGGRQRQYIRRGEVEQVRAACEVNRVLQIELRHGRAEYKQTMSRARELFRMLSQ
jgi:intergrase/recombinase